MPVLDRKGLGHHLTVPLLYWLFSSIEKLRESSVYCTEKTAGMMSLTCKNDSQCQKDILPGEKESHLKLIYNKKKKVYL